MDKTLENMQNIIRPKKRVFLALILASMGILAITIFLFWQLLFPGLAAIHLYLPQFLAGVLTIGILIVSIALLGMIFTLMGVQGFKFFRNTAWWTINMLFPVAVFLGKILDINKENIERSFIEVSNQLVKQSHMAIQPDRILILTPHCIQLDTCPHKITRDVNNCKKCGGCSVGELLSISQKYKVHFAVATGGTFARQIVRNIRPKAILAIACERDLTSGIQDVFPLPVIGVLNERPFGPCFNTKIEIKKVEEAILLLMNKD